MLTTQRQILFLFLISFACMLTITGKPLFNKQKFTISSKNAPQCEKAIIIVDLINVLFKESYIGFAQRIGYGTLTSYALTHWKNPGQRCLDMLHEISQNNDQQPHVTITLQEKIMPRCIVELHEGKKTCREVKNEMHNAITLLDKKNFFSSEKEKNLMLSIINLMLDPAIIAQLTEPIKPMISLMQKLKNNGHSLYLCANIPDEFYQELLKKYPTILALFNGIVVSSRINNAKPDKAIFEYLFSTHNINPKECILIDNAQESVSTAQSFGMQGIVYTKHSTLNSYLKKQGISP